MRRIMKYEKKAIKEYVVNVWKELEMLENTKKKGVLMGKLAKLIDKSHCQSHLLKKSLKENGNENTSGRQLNEESNLNNSSPITEIDEQVKTRIAGASKISKKLEEFEEKKKQEREKAGRRERYPDQT